jgi:hypothetical protein
MAPGTPGKQPPPELQQTITLLFGVKPVPVSVTVAPDGADIGEKVNEAAKTDDVRPSRPMVSARAIANQSFVNDHADGRGRRMMIPPGER